MFHVVVAEPTPEESEALPFYLGARPSATSQSVTLRLYRDTSVSISASLSSSPTLCVIAVPSLLGPADFCAFLGPLLGDVEHMRFLRPRTAQRARYAVLLRFKSQAAADRLFRAYNGRAFSSLQPNVTCRALYVAAVHVSGDGALLASGDSLRPVELPAVRASSPTLGSLVELPSCPVCLERLDSTASGLLTTICQHTFHCSCLSAWADDSCPVCRFCAAHPGEDEHKDGLSGDASQLLPGNGAVAEVDAAEGGLNEAGGGNACADDSGVNPSLGGGCDACGMRRDLWMCLVCGTRGCGRYAKQHALAHSVASAHDFAIELSSQRVWSYAADGYVHRLLQSRRDGKLVEAAPLYGSSVRDNVCVDAGSHDGSGASGGGIGGGATTGTGDFEAEPTMCGSDSDVSDARSRSLLDRLDGVAFEYTLLLTSQLESQRAYFEGMLQQLFSLASSNDSPTVRRAQAEAIFYSHHGSGPRDSSGASFADDSARARADAAQVASLSAALAAARADAAALRDAFASVDRERRSALHKASVSASRAEQLVVDVNFAKDVCDAAVTNARGLQAALIAERTLRAADAAAAAKNREELEEQVRDLSFALDAGVRLAAHADAVGADVVGVAAKKIHTPASLELKLQKRAAERAAASSAGVALAINGVAEAEAAAKALLADEEANARSSGGRSARSKKR